MIRDILFFQHNTEFGLTERYLSQLAIKLDRSKFRSHLVYPDANKLDEFKDLVEYGVNLHVLPEQVFNINFFHSIKIIRESLIDLKPDLIHFNDPGVIGMLAARLYNSSPIVMTHHTPELDRNYDLPGKILEKLAFLGNTEVIFTSEQDSRTGGILDGNYKWNHTVIPYGIDVSLFDGDLNKKDIFDRFNIPYDHKVVVNVARLVPQKGHKYLILAAENVIETIENVSFLIIGDGELRQELQYQVDQAGISDRCIFAGYVSDVHNILNVCDAFVMPSLFEGLCMAVLEASASGLPVVSTRVGGIPSVVVNDETGILVPVKDVDELTSGIMKMICNPEYSNRLGESGRNIVVEKFSVESMIKNTEDLYDRILGK